MWEEGQGVEENREITEGKGHGLKGKNEGR